MPRAVSAHAPGHINVACSRRPCGHRRHKPHCNGRACAATVCPDAGDRPNSPKKPRAAGQIFSYYRQPRRQRARRRGILRQDLLQVGRRKGAGPVRVLRFVAVPTPRVPPASRQTAPCQSVTTTHRASNHISMIHKDVISSGLSAGRDTATVLYPDDAWKVTMVFAKSFSSGESERPHRWCES